VLAMVSSPSRTFPLFRALIKAWPRASRPFTWLILLSAVAAFASEIREFDLKTIERLSNELTRVSQTRGRGATTPDRKRALQSARGALQGKMLNVHYDYVVLDDPDGSGFLVCALGSTGSPRQFVLGGHIRFIRWLHRGHNRSSLRTLLVEDEKHTGLPKGTHLVASYYNQIVSTKPVETLIYTSNVSKRPIFVDTPDGKMWKIANGTMSIDRPKPGSDTMSRAARKGFDTYGR
jgi:hypothetical protein